MSLSKGQKVSDHENNSRDPQSLYNKGLRYIIKILIHRSTITKSMHYCHVDLRPHGGLDVIHFELMSCNVLNFGRAFQHIF